MSGDDDERIVTGDGPVNARTALKDAMADRPIGREALARAERVHARNVMGAPMAQQLRSSRPDMQRASPLATQLAAAVLMASGAILLMLGVFQASGSWAAMGGLTALCGGLLFAWQASRRRPGPVAAVSAGPIFDAEMLERFDRALDAASRELSDAVGAQVLTLKEALVRIARAGASATPDEHFTLDDRMYLVECVRRYIPDTLEAYLKVPASQRTTPGMADGESAETLLQRQLNLLLEEVQRRELALGRSTAEGLVKQKRFLESKRRR